MRENIKALGWNITDLKVIIPGYSIHKIKFKEEFKRMVELQRRLNPTIKEVMKREVLKLLEASTIYHIFYSS